MGSFLRSLAMPLNAMSTSSLPSQMVGHLANRISQQVASSPLRRSYEALALERRQEAMYHVQLEASTSYSHSSPTHSEHLEGLASHYSGARDADKESIRAQTPEFLLAAIKDAEGRGHRAKKKEDRESRHPVLNIESATRTNVAPESYFKKALLNYLPHAPQEHVKAAASFANASSLSPEDVEWIPAKKDYH